MGGHVAFGVEANRRATYELRQARYHRLAEVVAAEVARVAREEDRPAEILDVGVGQGRTLRYLEPHLEDGEAVNLTGVDLFPRGKDQVYRSDEWRLLEMDVEDGLPGLPSGEYDVVVCEQVLEHLEDHAPLTTDLERVLRPGGVAVIGVPIFPFGLHRLRPLGVRAAALLTGRRDRSHVQQWSLGTLRNDLARLWSLRVREVRGFRIASGGPLRLLEFRRWWWRLNRWLGARVPGLCVEVQLVAVKEPWPVLEGAGS